LANSGRIATSYSLIARCVDIIDYVARNHAEADLFVKIDIEGHDPRVIDRLLNLLPQRKLFIIFEFAPVRFGSREEAAGYLKRLSKDFHLFDLYYCPNPTRFNRLDPDKLALFTAEVGERQHGYTDVFMLDKRTPAGDQLLKRLAELAPEPDAQMLVS